jgi:hypothetical protein
MTITRNPNGTFEFSRGGVLWQGFPTREAAQTAQYDLDRGIVPTLPHHEAPADLLLACLDWVDKQDAELDIAEWVDGQTPAAIVLSHLDEIAKTEEERAYVRHYCAVDGLELPSWAKLLSGQHVWTGIRSSPGAEEGGSTDGLTFTPKLSIQGDDLFVQVMGHPPTTPADRVEQRIYDAPQKVHEVVTLKRRGLVIMDTDEETIIMSHRECAEQEGFEMDEHAAAMERLPIEDRVFATVIRNYLAQVPDTHRAMAEAGLMLLAGASEGLGDALPADASDDAIDERGAQHIWQAAYNLGWKDGTTECIAELRAIHAKRRTGGA